VKIEIVIFDDMYTLYGKYITENLPIPSSVRVYDHIYQVCWHSDWNAVGDVYAGPLGIGSIKIDDSAKFGNALDWCLVFESRAICFCDYRLDGVVVDAESIGRVGQLAIAFAKAEDAEGAAKFYNSNRQGLLLAVALAKNKNAYIDIWLSTGDGVEVPQHVASLRKISAPGRFIGVADNIPKAGNCHRALEVIKIAVRRYESTRVRVDPGFWPAYAGKWFDSGRTFSPAPHSHGHYGLALEITSEHNLISYLETLGVEKEVGMTWLVQGRFYQVLKRFLGASSIAHTGKNALTLGCLVFPLLKADQSPTWARDLVWDVGSSVICSCDQDSSQELIIASFKLFQVLIHPRSYGVKSNSVRAQFCKKTDGTHFLVDFSFDCSVGESLAERSLASNLLISGIARKGSDVCSALFSLLDLIADPDVAAMLFVSVYPVQVDEKTWTRLDFKACT